MLSAQVQNLPTPSQDFLWAGRPVKALLFDMDGVIADTKQIHADAWAQWARRHGINVSRDEYLELYFGRSNHDVLPDLMPHLQGNRDAIDRVAREKEALFLDILATGALPALAGLHELVARAASRSIAMAVASAAPRENVERVTDHFDLQRFIPVRLSQSDVKRAKPAPDLFLEAAARLNIPPSNCVVFEDSKHGLEAGCAAGCRTIAITTLHPAEELRDLATLAVADFEELFLHEDWGLI